MKSVKKNIAFCFVSLSQSKLQYWLNCFEKLENNSMCEIHVWVENNEDMMTLRSASSNELRITPLCEADKKIKAYSYKEKEEISKKYIDYNFGKLRLQSFSSSLSCGYKFEDLLCTHVEYYEKLLKENDIDIVFLMEPKNSVYQSYAILLEAICDYSGKTILMIHGSGLWNAIGIFNNLHRSSEVLNGYYKQNLKENISKSDEKRVLDYFSAYYGYKESDELKEYWAKAAKPKGLRDRIKKGFYKRINLPKKYMYDDFEISNQKYAVLLLTKANNKRVHYLSPFYSEYPALIQNIAVSLPLTHSLLVREHPRMGGHGDPNIIDKIRAMGNCYYGSPDDNFFDVIENADMVFSVASSAAVEALTKFKHVVLFGEKSFVFGEYDAPVKRITNLEELPKVIRQCIDTLPPTKEIMTYFFSLLSNTYRWGEVPDSNWSDVSAEGFEKKMMKLIEIGIEKQV